MSTRTFNLAQRLRGLLRRAAGGLLAASLLAAIPAWAVPGVTYGATDLGANEWQFNYVVTGPLGGFESINMLFPFADYASLSVPGHDAAFGFALVTQPDAGFSLDGFVTVSADFAGIADGDKAAFDVRFTWLGTGDPGAQTFEHIDDGFNVLGTGLTSPIPGPPSWALMMLGLALLGSLQARRGRGG